MMGHAGLELRPVMGRLLAAVAGGAGISASNLLATLVLLRHASQTEFGLFAFGQVAITLGFGVSNALFGAPISVALNSPNQSDKDDVAESFGFFNLMFCIAGGSALVAAMWSLGSTVELSLLFGLSGLVHWMRWYRRAYSNAAHKHQAVLLSDGVYSTTLLLGLVAVEFASPTVASVLCLQLFAALLGFAVIRVDRRTAVATTRIAPFLRSFRANGRHALLGVLSTEVTANAHSYLVTAVVGPTAFATVAAAQLFFRPVGVVLTSITQFERPRISALMQRSELTHAIHSTRTFTRLIWISLLGNVVLVFAFSGVFVEALASKGYDSGALTVALVLSASVSAMRCVRAPLSLLMQAAGSFKALARATVASAFIASPVVWLLVSVTTVEWSLAGVLAAEVACAVMIFRAARGLFPPRLPIGASR